jgi:hypothetical protein
LNIQKVCPVHPHACGEHWFLIDMGLSGMMADLFMAGNLIEIIAFPFPLS